MDHRARVWVILGANVVERRMDTGFRGYPMLSEFGIMFGWQTQRSDSGGCGMRMRSLVFVRYTRCAVFSVRIEHPNNLQAINTHCHARKTIEEQGKTVKPKRYIGLDGFPIV